MPKADGGWDAPLVIELDERKFQQTLAIEMESHTPQKTGTLRRGNRVFRLEQYTFSVKNKEPYSLAQHDGADYKAGVTWWQRHGAKRVLHTRKKAWSLAGHQWVPKGFTVAARELGVGWKQVTK